MGWFSSKKKTYVSSVAYPLGEDGDDRVDMLKYTVLNSILQQRSIAENISQTYLRGQGMSLRNSFRYARDHYAHGVPKSNALYSNEPDLVVLREIIEGTHGGTEITFITTMVGTSDYVWWAERYLAQTYGYDRVSKQFNSPPAGVEYNANVAYDLEPNGTIRILLMNADGATTTLDYIPVGLVGRASYVHSAYRTVLYSTDAPVTTTRDAEAGEQNSITTTTTTTEVIGETRRVITRVTVTIAGAVATVLTEIDRKTTSRSSYFIYRIGEGTYPEVDTWLTSENLTSPYYPSVPLRVNNVDMTSDVKQSTELYKTSKKLLKRIGVSIEDLSDSMKENPDLDQIDYAYVTFGVGLKAQAPECKKYLFRFFQHMRNISLVTSADYASWEEGFNASPTTNVTTPPVNMLTVYSEVDRANNHDIQLQWQYIDTDLVTGEVFPGARPGDVTVEVGGAQITINLMVDIVLDNSKLVARRQVDANTYEELIISGLVYENFIYEGKSVIITAYEAMTDPDEGGFIVPLNQVIVRSTPLVELTNLAYQCTHMVFNCYQIVKQKWYQSNWFKVILVIVSIIIIWVTWGAGTPAVAGFWGTMIAYVGLTLAISAALASLIVAAIYVLVMMIIMSILTKVAVKAFGPTWGPIIAMVAMFVTMNWGNLTAMAANASANGVSSVVTASSLMQASTMMLNAYGAYAGGQMTKLQKEALGLETEFDKQMKELEELTKLNLDTSLDMIDIQGYTEATNTLFFEKHDTFITRTLLTGSDICEITSGMVESFADVGLMLPNTG